MTARALIVCGLFSDYKKAKSDLTVAVSVKTQNHKGKVQPVCRMQKATYIANYSAKYVW